MATTATKTNEPRKEHIPDMIVNPGTGKRYLKGRFLGKVRLALFSFTLILLNKKLLSDLYLIHVTSYY